MARTRQTKTVLVVDDGQDFLKLMKIALGVQGHAVLTARNGREALKVLETEKPDGIILDILMPRLNGLRVLKRIRARDKQLPIFIVTAFPNEARFRTARRLGASGFIVKTGDPVEEAKRISAAFRVAAPARRP